MFWAPILVLIVLVVGAFWAELWCWPLSPIWFLLLFLAGGLAAVVLFFLAEP